MMFLMLLMLLLLADSTQLAGNTNAALDYYLRKNFYKTASLMGHSCLAAAVLGVCVCVRECVCVCVYMRI